MFITVSKEAANRLKQVSNAVEASHLKRLFGIPDAAIPATKEQVSSIKDPDKRRAYMSSLINGTLYSLDR